MDTDEMHNPHMEDPMTDSPPSSQEPMIRRLLTRTTFLTEPGPDPRTSRTRTWARLKAALASRQSDADLAAAQAWKTGPLLPLAARVGSPAAPDPRTRCSLCAGREGGGGGGGGGGEFEILKSLPCCLRAVGDECWRAYVVGRGRGRPRARGRPAIVLCPFCGVGDGEAAMHLDLHRDSVMMPAELLPEKEEAGREQETGFGLGPVEGSDGGSGVGVRFAARPYSDKLREQVFVQSSRPRVHWLGRRSTMNTAARLYE